VNVPSVPGLRDVIEGIKAFSQGARDQGYYRAKGGAMPSPF